MANKKKRKYQHPYNHHSKKQLSDDDLTHDEIWDDSALIRSWDYALEEYNFYHSIHTRGEDVEEVLRRAEAEDRAASEASKDSSGDAKDDGVDEGEISEGEVDESETNAEVLVPSSPVKADALVEGEVDADVDVSIDKNVTLVADSFSGVPRESKVEATMVNGEASTDGEIDLTPAQILENVKMSYYWAGYYTGLYEQHMKVHEKPA